MIEHAKPTENRLSQDHVSQLSGYFITLVPDINYFLLLFLSPVGSILKTTIVFVVNYPMVRDLRRPIWLELGFTVSGVIEYKIQQ